MMETKQALRRTAQLRRASLPQAQLEALSEALAPLLAEADRVASYVGYGNEPAVTPRTGWLLPVLLPDDDLDWAAFDGELHPGRRGLLEPGGPRLGVSAIGTCDLVLVPALLVDRNGNRLGKGGGSYDRALGRVRGLTVALLHDGELVDVLPHEDHDVPVDAAVTPLGGLTRFTR